MQVIKALVEKDLRTNSLVFEKTSLEDLVGVLAEPRRIRPGSSDCSAASSRRPDEDRDDEDCLYEYEY